MGRLMDRLRARFNADDDDNEDEAPVNDEDAEGLSHVGQAAYQVLSTQHGEHHLRLWNVTTGSVVGEEMDATPPKTVFDLEEDPEEGHSDWFPEKMAAIIKRTKVWCDIMSLGPPDGKFLEEIRDAITHVHREASEENPPVVIRMMFGNIIGMPVDCTGVCAELTRDIPEDDSNVMVWVGAWRNGVSWNHAKIIAVDGKYLHTGGHNMWDKHYLRQSPVFDLSIELSGACTHDAHMFANNAWKYVKHVQGRFMGRLTENLPDSAITVLKRRVTVTDYPEEEAGEFPPLYQVGMVPTEDDEDPVEPGDLKIITMGRTGSGAHPADDAFCAMIDSAQTIVRLALQDLGPVCFPGSKRPLPGCIWPHAYLNAMARVIWEKGVDVEILLSNPGSIPGGLGGMEANYGNGWSCIDVASEIIKSIQKQFPDADEEHLAQKVTDNLRICFLKCPFGSTYADGTSMGMHAKHFIVDDVLTYVGSQNLYVCDLSEWGVCIDDADKTCELKANYWDPMWAASFTGEDVNVEEVMEGLGIDRDGDDPDGLSPEDQAAAALATAHCSHEYLKDHDSDSE